MKRAVLISLFASLHFCVAAGPSASRIADAIYLAEGGPRARAPYGILSVKVKSEAHARQICLRTIENAWSDYRSTRDPRPFVHFLADRYCPPSVDPVGNRNWKRNVTFFLK